MNFEHEYHKLLKIKLQPQWFPLKPIKLWIIQHTSWHFIYCVKCTCNWLQQSQNVTFPNTDFSRLTLSCSSVTLICATYDLWDEAYELRALFCHYMLGTNWIRKYLKVWYKNILNTCKHHVMKFSHFIGRKVL